MTFARRFITEVTPPLAAFLVFVGVGALMLNFVYANPQSALPILLEAGPWWSLMFLALAALGAALPMFLVTRWALWRLNRPTLVPA